MEIRTLINSYQCEETTVLSELIIIVKLKLMLYHFKVPVEKKETDGGNMYTFYILFMCKSILLILIIYNVIFWKVIFSILNSVFKCKEKLLKN